MKELKDYLHLYLGCEVIAPNPYDDDGKEAKGILTGIHGEYGPEVQFIIDGNAEESPEYPNYANIKLILRPLSDMTDKQKQRFTDHFGKLLLLRPEGVRELLAEGFDLFGLIEAGLAIDKTTLKQEA